MSWRKLRVAKFSKISRFFPRCVVSFSSLFDYQGLSVDIMLANEMGLPSWSFFFSSFPEQCGLHYGVPAWSATKID